MPQSWHSQHHPPLGASGQTQSSYNASDAMPPNGYQQGSSGILPENVSMYNVQRNSPTVCRPPSSASTSSASSLSYSNLSQQALPQLENFPARHRSGFQPCLVPDPQLGGNAGGRGTHFGVHHVPAQYPMPPRNPSIGRNLMPVGPYGMYHRTAQPLRQVSNGNVLSRDPYTTVPSAEPEYVLGSKQQHGPPSLPYGRSAVAGAHPDYHGHYQDSRFQAQYNNLREVRRTFSSRQNHYGHQSFEGHGTCNRLQYENSENQVERKRLEDPSIENSPKLVDSSCSTAGKQLNHGDATQTDQAETSSSDDKPVAASLAQTKTNNTNNHDDDDAASILLQLSGLSSQSKASNSPSSDPSVAAASRHNCRKRSLPSKVPSAFIKPIEPSSSLEEDATIATVECAPDLTSEPSNDTNEQNECDFPAPIPENYPTRLALPYDDSKLNSLHCFLRSELLEVFVVQKSSQKSPTHSPGSSVGRVGLRCVHCAMVGRQKEDRDEAPMAVFYPKSIAEIYRLVTSWQRCHLRKCKNLPPSLRLKWNSLRESDKSRGKTHYWITSAKEIGLVDCHSRAGGIRFGPKLTPQLQTSEPVHSLSKSSNILTETSTLLVGDTGGPPA